MDALALEDRLSRMEQEIAGLRRENQSLRAVPEAKQDARGGEVLSRRGLLTGAAAYTLGAVGLSIAGTRSAEASLGTMRYGDVNNAGTSFTSLQAANESYTLYVLNTSPSTACVALRALTYNGTAIQAQSDGTGHTLFAFKKGDFGNGVYAYQSSSTSSEAAIFGETEGAGPGLCGRSAGSGNSVLGELTSPLHTQSAVLGRTEGTGAAIEGQSILGRGGVFKGKKAQIRLVASSATNKPSTGSRGDLFVDSSGRLWYCKTGGSTSGWVQLA